MIMNTETSRTPVTVSQLNEYIKKLVDSDGFLGSIAVTGEISNFTNHYKTGHFYFSLKDEGAQIKAVMFRGSASKLKFAPENGMKVIATGRVSVFPRDGQYQLYVESMEPDGVGALYVAFEQLKRRLEAEGLFSQSRKKPLPKIPTRVGIITSPTGAAVRDMINISRRRFPAAKLVLYPALVQGDGAPAQLIAGLKYFNTAKSVDVIIIGRGGGSIEDLWAFNDEGVARAVAASAIPVVSAVGHETDFTICDFAADCRAPTPSAAAELALPETNELKAKIAALIDREKVVLGRRIAESRAAVDRLAASRALSSPRVFIDDRRMTLASLEEKLLSSMQAGAVRRRAQLSTEAGRLDALSPMAVLSRGYGVLYGGDGKIIKSVNDVTVGGDISCRTSDGEIDARVLRVRRDTEG
jgi:exodeoxyribonuclease VII large subunit